ncbi:hypothetical protein [Sphingorhabdus sp. EL138]|uniref:hypothetical protein n=1 Tax=Sphingorhabdus sp. EL138 TaxID=2073156 RepID=UPI0025F699A5|nr:hypothetical protein [Sphingorhabdus sp. EL138]
MNTANTAAQAGITKQPAIIKNEGNFKNKKEINMPIYNTNYVLFDKTNLSNLPEVVLDHISSTLTKEGIGHTSFDWKCLILERSPEFIAIEACECCGNIKISANLGVENPYGHTHEFVERNLSKLINDEWCKALSFCDKDGHIISLEMFVPCNGSSLLNFSMSMEEFEQKLKSFLAVASKLGLEIVIDDDTELTACSN